MTAGGCPPSPVFTVIGFWFEMYEVLARTITDIVMTGSVGQAHFFLTTS
jgi:hypothetical protein